MKLFMVKTDWESYLLVRENVEQAMKEACRREGRMVNIHVKRVKEIDGFKIDLTPIKTFTPNQTFDKCFIHIGDKVIEGKNVEIDTLDKWGGIHIARMVKWLS